MLPFPNPPDLRCAAGLGEPAVWLRRLVLWHDLSQEPVRNIEMRRGINIVWSPTGSDAQAVATGHAAGKTLLCRLIRYCFGEDSFADPEDTQAIQTRFPTGAVAAEIRLRGTTWAVRRGFAIPRDERAQKAESVDQLSDESLHGSYGVFLAELEATVF